MTDKDDELMMMGAKLSSEMGQILFGELKKRLTEEAFKIATYAISSLLADFIHLSIHKDNLTARFRLLADIIHMSAQLFRAKDEIREAEKKDKH